MSYLFFKIEEKITRIREDKSIGSKSWGKVEFDMPHMANFSATCVSPCVFVGKVAAI
jgi:hypothetical protein